MVRHRSKSVAWSLSNEDGNTAVLTSELACRPPIGRTEAFWAINIVFAATVLELLCRI